MVRNVWRKSSRSGNNGQCVEVRDRGTQVDVRDSKAPTVAVLSFEAAAWDAFISGIKTDLSHP